MDMLWSMSTTIREGERIVGFLKTALELDGQKWDEETQKKFQILLIKNRQYLNNPDNKQSFNKLNEEQSRILKDKSIDMTYEEAKGIFDSKEYKDPAMRGRQSMSPLVKLGLVYIIGDEKIINITDVGKKLANDEISFNDFMLDSMLKFQYPNPYESGFKDWNTKPFINTLRLIKRVNELCKERGIKEKGISKTEFGIFVLSLKSYTDIEVVAKEILNFREQLGSYTDDTDKEIYISNYIKKYLNGFKNPEDNVKEYTDNMVRYIRLTKYIYIRGKYAHTYIDLEPRRMTEINSILEADDGSAKTYSPTEWREYMGVYGTYELPFETVATLTTIATEVEKEIKEIEDKLNITNSVISIPNTKDKLKEVIEERREYRTRLQNLEIKNDYHANVSKIDEAINALKDIRMRNKPKLVKKYSIELEKWTNVALNIINDSVLIKPNAPVGDDNEPTYTAPNGVPDIECYYEKFGAICEVTMLTSRDQWYNEGQPVMRHLRIFENNNTETPNYCLFIAPTLHVDTVNTFYMSVKYEYEGKAQKIIPITIVQLESILETMKKLVLKGKSLKHADVMKLYDNCANVSSLTSSSVWLEHISNELNDWETKLVS